MLCVYVFDVRVCFVYVCVCVSVCVYVCLSVFVSVMKSGYGEVGRCFADVVIVPDSKYPRSRATRVANGFMLRAGCMRTSEPGPNFTEFPIRRKC